MCHSNTLCLCRKYYKIQRVCHYVRRPDGYNPLNNSNKDRKALEIRRDLKPRCLVHPSIRPSVCLCVCLSGPLSEPRAGIRLCVCLSLSLFWENCLQTRQITTLSTAPDDTVTERLGQTGARIILRSDESTALSQGHGTITSTTTTAAAAAMRT